MIARVGEQRLEPRAEILIEHPDDEAETLPRAAGGESAVEVGDVVLLDDRERGRGLEAGIAQVGDVPAIAFEHADVHLLEPGAKPRLEPLAEHDHALAERDQLLGEPDRDPVRPGDDERLRHGAAFVVRWPAPASTRGREFWSELASGWA